MPKYCQACGMPLTKKEDFALGDENANFCLHCVNADGSVKSCEEIFEGGVQFFMSQVSEDRNMAIKLVRKNMNSLPYWQDQNHEILKGEMATDLEFMEMLKKLG